MLGRGCGARGSDLSVCTGNLGLILYRPPFHRLQQAPTRPVEFRLRTDKKAFPVSLSPDALTFNETNWNVAQFVTIDAGELSG